GWFGEVGEPFGVGRGLLFGQGRGGACGPEGRIRRRSGGNPDGTASDHGQAGVVQEIRSSRRVMSESKPEYSRSAVDSVVDAVRGLVSEGVNRRVVVRDSKDDVVLEVPMALGVIAALAAPVATTIGAGVALVGKCEIKLEDRRRPGAQPATTT